MDEDSSFRCRKCRLNLFSVKQLASHKDQKERDRRGAGQIDLFSHEKCSSWFLEDDEMLPWVRDSVEEAQWTEGKLYCPKCKSRIGAFDFIHGIHCNCGKFIIPAVWIQKSRVDLILPTSQMTNLDIRSPSISFNQSTRNSFGKTAELQNNITKSFVGNISEFDCTDFRGNTDTTQIASSSVFSVVDANGRLVDSEGNDIRHCIDEGTSSCNSTSDIVMENIPSSLKMLAYKFSSRRREISTCTKHTCRFGCALHCDSSKATKLNSNTSRARGILNDKETYKQRSRRKTKGRHQILPEANNLLDITTDQREEKSSICQFSDQTTYYSCLPVDEVSSEPLCKTVENKTISVEIQDHHCCAVCLDLFYEPFKCSCDHVFCDPCLRQLNFRSSSRGSVRCPLCRQIVEQLTPATELRNEIRQTYDPQLLRKRDKVERRAAYRKWPLPANQGPLRRNTSHTRRSVTLPCIIYIFLIGASMYMLLLIAFLSNLTTNNVISLYKMT